MRCSHQLSYEATDVGSWLIRCSYVPVKMMNVLNVYILVYEIYQIRTVEMKSNEERSSQLWTRFMQLYIKPEKISGLHFFQAPYTSTASSWVQILLKSWIFFRPLRQLHKLCSQLLGSFLIWCIKFIVILPLSHFAQNPYNCSDSESGNHGTPSNNSNEPDGKSNCFANV